MNPLRAELIEQMHFATRAKAALIQRLATGPVAERPKTLAALQQVRKVRRLCISKYRRLIIISPGHHPDEGPDRGAAAP